MGVAIAPDGGFYIADYNHHRVRRVGLDGIITPLQALVNQATQAMADPQWLPDWLVR